MKFKRDADNHFAAVFIAPTACRNAVRNIRGYFGFDATHTRSKYPKMLCICCSLDANDQIVPLAWALVPTENDFGGIGFARNAKTLLTSLITSTV
jgi:hypothetical protein